MIAHGTTIGTLTLALAGPWTLVGFSACNGTISEPASGGNANATSSETGSSGSSVDAFQCASTIPSSGPAMGPSALLLSRTQYLNTQQGLFGAATPNLDRVLARRQR
jgi:hypothetical protein